MHSEDDIQYAFEMTRVLHEPDRRIDTFGSTSFDFVLITELLDSVDRVRVREGRLEADKPQILRPDSTAEFDFDGFGEQAEAFGSWLRENASHFAFLRYGFNFKRTNVTESLLHEPFEDVSERIREDVRQTGNPIKAVISGLDEAWEISLLRFTLEMIQKSQEINTFDFKRRGLL